MKLDPDMDGPNSIEPNLNSNDSSFDIKGMSDCKHCGRCCLSGIPCGVGQILFDITDVNPTECPACVTEDGLLWCGIMKDPVKWLGPMLDNVGWKCEAMAEIFAVYIGIGAGCGVSPTMKQIAKQMKEFYDSMRKPAFEENPKHCPRCGTGLSPGMIHSCH